MKLKTIKHEGKTYAEVSDGKPVYLDDEGKEHRYDAPAMRGSLDKLNGVLSEERGKLQALSDKIKTFDGLDAEAARAALQTLDSIDKKKLIDAGEIDKVKAQISEGYDKQLAEKDKAYSELERTHQTDKINLAFQGSKFVKDRLAIPADMVQSAFARNFQFANGTIKPVDNNGNPIYSESNPAELASFDEALERIVSQYPSRDAIMKGTGHSGSGSGPVDGGNGGSKMRRSDFDALPAGKQHEIATKGDVQIID